MSNDQGFSDPALWPRYHYRGEVVRVVDGDTVVLSLDLGLRTYRQVAVRLAGYDAPEPFSGDEAERARGRAATAALVELLSDLAGGWRSVYVRTHKDKKSFDRYVVELLVERDGRLVYVTDLIGRGIDST